MKKIIFVILIALFAAVFAINIYAGNQLKLFYNNNLVNLSQEIIVQENEYFINAKELTAVIGTSCKIDLSNRSLTIKVDDSVLHYEIKSYDYSIIDSSTISHNAPELINGKVYFSFGFITELYNVTVKYDKKANLLYFFPRDLKIETFVNDKYNYNLAMPENLYLDLGESYDNLDVSSISVMNQDNTFSASIICDEVNRSTLKNMRFLLSDYVSPDDYIFNRIVEYKQSYFRSLLESYKNEFLFGNMDKTLSESNIKIIRDYSEKLFGQNSDIILFNTISSNKFISAEDTNIIITIPSYVNESIYSLTFTMEKGTLNESNINNIVQIIKGLTITNHSEQENVPEILNDQTSINASNRGIYPILLTSEIEYTLLEDTLNFYNIKYPSYFIPYLHNNFIDNHSYRSFKINHNSFFSISSEHLTGKSDRIMEKINSLKSYYSNKISVISVETKNVNGKDFVVLNYEIDNNYTKEFVTDYFITNGLCVYTIELRSLVSKPTEDVLGEFIKIVSSFEFTTHKNVNDINKNISFVKFSNDREGYSIFYPDNWSIQDNSQDINYDSFEITNENFSGPLNIFVNESEYSSNLTTSELLRYTTGYDSSLGKYFKNYTTPYTNKTFKVLNISATTYKDVTKIYKLVNYIDEGDRYKLCYSIDLIRNNKINSLFISASEYLFQDGVLADKNLNYILEFMTESFQLEEKEEYQKTLLEGEKRNNKLIFIESFFKKALGEATTVTFAKNLSSEKDVLVYINNSNKSGAYRLQFDYNNKNIQVSSRVLNSTIIKSAEEKMRDMLKGKYIHNILVNSDDMTISVKYSEISDSLPVNKTYYLLVTPSKNDYSIEFLRKFTADSIKERCQNFLENYLLTSVQIYFPKNYSYTNENFNKYYYEKRLIPVFANFDGQSGYFYLEIDPVSDSVKIIKYVSKMNLKERLQDYFSLIDPSSVVLDYKNADSDNFCFYVSIISEKDKLSKKLIYMYYDQDLVFLSKDPYFSGVLLQ